MQNCSGISLPFFLSPRKLKTVVADNSFMDLNWLYGLSLPPFLEKEMMKERRINTEMKLLWIYNIWVFGIQMVLSGAPISCSFV